MRGFSFDIYCKNLNKLLEVNLTKKLKTVEFLTRTCPHRASSNWPITVVVCLPSTASHGSFWVSAQVSCDSLYLLPVLHSWGLLCALLHHFSHGSWKTYWFFNVFSFLLVVGTVCGTPNEFFLCNAITPLITFVCLLSYCYYRKCQLYTTAERLEQWTSAPRINNEPHGHVMNSWTNLRCFVHK